MKIETWKIIAKVLMWISCFGILGIVMSPSDKSVLFAKIFFSGFVLAVFIRTCIYFKNKKGEEENS